MGIKECCSAFLAGLPDPALPLLHSLIMGTSVAALLLLFFYKKYTNLPLKIILIHMFKKVFYLLPNHDHSESEVCKNPDCVRCSKYEVLKDQIITKWNNLKLNEPDSVSNRLEDAIRKLQGISTSESAGEHSKKEKRSPYVEFQRPTIFHMNLAANPYWNDFEVFKLEIELLKLNFTIIMNEFKLVFDALKNGDSCGWKLNDINMGHWCIFPFIDQGILNESNCRRCPNVAGILGALPSIMKDCVFGNACFSILYPDSYIKPHHGPSNVRLRCHVGLLIPDGCWLEVAGTQYKWKEQEIVIFDDSFEHSAAFMNQSSSLQASPRAVLLIDFWHPDVTSDEKKDLLELLAP